MAVDTLCFETIPAPMLRVFTSDERVVEIGRWELRFIGSSFISRATFLVFPAVFKRRAPQPRRCCKRRCPPLHNRNRSGTEKPPQSCSFCGGFFCRPSGCVLMSGL